VRRFHLIGNKFSHHEIRKNAERFSIERFKREFENFVDSGIEEFRGLKRAETSEI